YYATFGDDTTIDCKKQSMTSIAPSYAMSMLPDINDLSSTTTTVPSIESSERIGVSASAPIDIPTIIPPTSASMSVPLPASPPPLALPLPSTLPSVSTSPSAADKSQLSIDNQPAVDNFSPIRSEPSTKPDQSNETSLPTSQTQRTL